MAQTYPAARLSAAAQKTSEIWTLVNNGVMTIREAAVEVQEIRQDLTLPVLSVDEIEANLRKLWELAHKSEPANTWPTWMTKDRAE